MEIIDGARLVRFFTVLVALGVLSIAPAPVLAQNAGCGCPKYTDNVKEHASRWGVVFLGKLADKRLQFPKRWAPVDHTFEVKTVWKGHLKRRVVVTANSSRAACGDLLIPGESYLVFANPRAKGKYGTTVCANNRREDAAQTWIRDLGQGKQP